MFPNLARCVVGGIVHANDHPELGLEIPRVYPPDLRLSMLEHDMRRFAQQIVMTPENAEGLLRDLNQLDSEMPPGQSRYGHMRAIQNMLTLPGGHHFIGIGQLGIGYRIVLKNDTQFEVTVTVNKHDPYHLDMAQSTMTNSVPVGWLFEFAKLVAAWAAEADFGNEKDEANHAALKASIAYPGFSDWLTRVLGKQIAKDFSSPEDDDPMVQMTQMLEPMPLLASMLKQWKTFEQFEFRSNQFLTTILLLELVPLTHDAIAMLLYRPGQAAERLNKRETEFNPAVGPE